LKGEGASEFRPLNYYSEFLDKAIQKKKDEASGAEKGKVKVNSKLFQKIFEEDWTKGLSK